MPQQIRFQIPKSQNPLTGEVLEAMITLAKSETKSNVVHATQLHSPK